ncbi:hypothetical protein [Nonomuraea maritima]|uniref:hypothetical protein n=1 Tax=Nonomuraea maritima TaxID=683260 RepID=UPI00371B54B3
MEFWKAILALARQKHVSIPVAVLVVALACTGYLVLPDRYVTSASLVLVTPSGGGAVDRTRSVAQTNPLLQFSDDLRTTASILILAMNTKDVFDSVGAPEDGPTDLTVDDGRSNPTLLGVGTTGPFIYVEVESDSPATATGVLEAVEKRLEQELVNRQQELQAPLITYVRLDEVVRLVPEADLSIRVQGAVGGALLGLLLGLGAAYAVARRKQTRVARSSPAPATEEHAPEPEHQKAPAHPTAAEPEAPPVDVPEAEPETLGAVSARGRGPALTDADETGPIDIVRVDR